MGLRRQDRRPAASAAVHALDESRPGLIALCGVDLTGEPELPAAAAVTCPACAKRNR